MIDVYPLLRPHQHEPVQHLCRVLREFDSAVDWSDTGTGKTYTAIATSIRLELPVLAVVPKISITAWNRAAAHFKDTISAINYETLRTGHTPFGRWTNQEKVDAGRDEVLVCEVCQQKNPSSPCAYHPAGIHCFSIKKKPIRYGDFQFHPAVKMLIFDEAHRCNGLDSLNAELLIASKRQKIKTLCLSATPGMGPLQMRALGYSLDLHCLDMKGLVSRSRGAQSKVFEGWIAGHGCKRIPAFHGWHWMVGAERQRQTMAEISAQVIPHRGVRVTTEQIPGFPERDISAELYDIQKSSDISGVYDELLSSLSTLSEKRGTDVDPEHPLTKLLRAHQEIELLKVPLAAELAADSLARGLSIGIFCNFSETIRLLAQKLDCPIIDGSVTGEARQNIIDSFQSNQVRCLVANIKAGGICISLQDLDGEHPRMGLVMPSFSAEAMIQVFGRFHREGGKSKCFYRVLLAAGTVEEKIFRSFNSKRNNIDALTDGDLNPLDIPLTRFQ